MLSLTFLDVFVSFKNLTKHIINFFLINKKIDEYYVKLDSYYYCKRKKCNIAVIRFRNKRAVEKIPVLEMVNDKFYLKELHPLDTCMLGILANNERNGLIDNSRLHKIQRLKNCKCLIRSEPILKISGKYMDEHGIEITTLYSAILNKEITIPTIEIIKNQALIYSLDNMEAISIGYNFSEQYLRNMTKV